MLLIRLFFIRLETQVAKKISCSLLLCGLLIELNHIQLLRWLVEIKCEILQWWLLLLSWLLIEKEEVIRLLCCLRLSA